MTRHVVPEDEFGALFTTVRRSSWRWECQGHYAVDEPELDAWLGGTPVEESDDDRAWVAYIRGLRAANIPFERVRMITDPPTPYLRWMLATTYRNIDAGEDVRWLDEAKATARGMPSYDFYIFDDDRVAVLEFEAGDMVRVFVDDDPGFVAEHRRYRALTWQAAIPHGEYIR